VIELSLNGAAHSVAAGTTLAALLEALGQQQDKLATAINGEFVPRGVRRERVLRAGDQVMCFHAVVGG